MISNLEYKIEVFLPEEFLEAIQEALTDVGAGRIGNYDYCFSVSHVQGSWRPLEGSQPFSGRQNEISRSAEVKLEVSMPAAVVPAAVEAIYRAHPYEEPLINILPLANHTFINKH